MRFIRLLFVAVLAIILVGIALANRGTVTVRAVPEGLEQYFWGGWQITIPLFLVIFLAILFGIVIGLIWEWLREAHIRSEAARRKEEVAQLQREVGSLRDTHNAPRDEVKAILDKPKPVPSAEPAPGSTLPATR
ncbi:lipopolysaccharide assembly LapA domain-containing protein [Paracoccus sp. SCSIO 75233]|uniref:LapA family protein n=1 Tax=Paracoccus sp. SCSIO 75233 TaxID=3017782 RepID=UPI0022F02E6E|nr:LapA family protein [Paracoccus sp. SCSIO 75233]WBU54548.1 LapA family protein [Paracoccus sp. SCSIO 75233]